MSVRKMIYMLPTPEEKFLLDIKNDSYFEYISNSVGIDNIFNPFDVVDFNIKNNLDYYIKDEYVYVRKTFLEEEVGDLSGDSDFYYKLNKNGFRSKSFDSFDKNKINVLFAGCSVTFGNGIPEGYTWPDLTISKLKDKLKKDIDFYNLALPGAGAFLNYKNIISFIKNIGIPDYIFISLPETTRSLFWNEEESIFSNVLLDAYFKPVQDTHRESFIQENSLMNIITVMHSLEYICNVLNIKLFWTSWNEVSANVYSKFNFKNFFIFSPGHPLSVIPPKIGMDEAKLKDSILKKKQRDLDAKILSKLNVNNLPFWLVARDALHPGTCFSEFYSEEFIKQIFSKTH